MANNKERKQINVRVDEEIERQISRLMVLLSAELGVTITITDVVRLGVLELAKKHPEEERPKGGRK